MAENPTGPPVCDGNEHVPFVTRATRPNRLSLHYLPVRGQPKEDRVAEDLAHRLVDRSHALSENSTMASRSPSANSRTSTSGLIAKLELTSRQRGARVGVCWFANAGQPFPWGPVGERSAISGPSRDTRTARLSEIRAAVRYEMPPSGIQTRATALKGPRPGPLIDGGPPAAFSGP